MESKDNNILLYTIVSLAIILLGLVIYALNKKKKTKIDPKKIQKPIQPMKNQQTKFDQNMEEEWPEFTDDNEYKTIKIVKSSPKTLEFIKL